MKVTKLVAIAGISGVVLAGAITTPAYAWHPKGEIKKYVQNITTNSAKSDANTDTTAVSAKPGDELKYTIVISNTAAAASNQYNDLYYIKLTDTLPAGVELKSNPSQRTITEDLGMLTPGKSVTKEYTVKVTSNKDKQAIDNTACFTGDSKVKDNKQAGCDIAKVKVTVPPAPEQPKPEQPKPEAPKTETPKVETPKVETPVVAQPVELPKTGASSILAPLAAVTAGVAGYAGRLIAINRRQK